MAISHLQFFPAPVSITDVCAICLGSFDPTMPAVAHSGPDGPKHPFHKRCVIQLRQDQCPICNKKIDLFSCLSWTEKLATTTQTFSSHACCAFLTTSTIHLVGEHIHGPSLIGLGMLAHASGFSIRRFWQRLGYDPNALGVALTTTAVFFLTFPIHLSSQEFALLSSTFCGTMAGTLAALNQETLYH